MTTAPGLTAPNPVTSTGKPASTEAAVARRSERSRRNDEPPRARQPPTRFSELEPVSHFRAETPGPSLVILGGVHGNEVSGIAALHRILARLEAHPPGCGEVVLAVGNRAAAAGGIRFVDRDLNRGWEADHVEALLADAASGDYAHAAEDDEVRRIASILNLARETARGPLYLLDLHSTSGASLPFLNVGDCIPSRQLARAIPCPVVLGLDEALSGTLLQWAEEHGWVGLVFEAGQHEDPRSIEAAEAACWVTLDHLRMLDRSSDRTVRERVRSSRRLLAKVTRGEHHMFEVIERHHLDDRTTFEMVPGFRSFQRIEAGELLAHEGGELLRASRGGYLLMPLYQAQGDDGYFLMRRYGAVRQLVARMVRRLRLDRLLRFLPGIERPTNDALVPTRRRLVVDEAWLHGRRSDLLLMLGYRHLPRAGEPSGSREKIELSRRRQRQLPPHRFHRL